MGAVDVRSGVLRKSGFKGIMVRHQPLPHNAAEQGLTPQCEAWSRIVADENYRARGFGLLISPMELNDELAA